MEVKLESLEFHGSDIKSMLFNFEESTIDLKIEIWDDQTKSPQEIVIKFLNPDQINLSEIYNFHESEIFRFNIESDSTGKHINIIFLEGFGERDFELKFSCKDLELRKDYSSESKIK